MYEHHKHKLLTWEQFVWRALRHLVWGLGAIAVGVGIGTFGYHALGRLGWIDAFLNASMILGGMGPVDRMETSAAKIFAALYALFSGLIFIGVAGVIAAPWIHRLFHLLHIDEGNRA